jgi:opacity protein-like surface antigen
MRGWVRAAVGIAFFSGSAFAQTAGTYVTSETSSSPPAALNVQPSPLNQTESFGFGNSRATTYGYDFGHGFKTELEGVTSSAASDRLGGLAAGGNVTGTRVTLKGMYEFSDGAWRMRPYVGAGIGAVDVNQHVLGAAANRLLSAYQLRGGVQLGFTQKLVGSLEYRWTNGSKPIFALAGVPTKVEVDRHGFTIGFNYKY